MLTEFSRSLPPDGALACQGAQHVNSPWLELTEVGQEAHACVCVLLAVLVLDHFPHFCELSVMSEIDLRVFCACHEISTIMPRNLHASPCIASCTGSQHNEIESSFSAVQRPGGLLCWLLGRASRGGWRIQGNSRPRGVALFCHRGARVVRHLPPLR